MPETKKKKKRYIDVNLPREWQLYLDEALKKPEIKKELEIGNFSKTYSGLGAWVIRRFLVDNTSFRMQYFNTYEDHATIIDNRIRRIIDLYPKPNGELWCEHCDRTDCEHVQFALTVPEIAEPLKKMKRNV